jgi:mRNA interferase RelE/StbE
VLRLDLSRRAARFLDGLPARQFRQVMKKVIALMVDPEPHDSEPLRGYPYRRADVGEYRIVYDVAGYTLQMLIIGKRNDDEVYRQLR